MPPLYLHKAHDLLMDFFAQGQRRIFSRHTVIVDYASPPEAAYLIESGIVKIVASSKTGREKIIHLYREGEVFPITYIFANSLYDVSYVAYTDLVVRQRSVSEARQFFLEHKLSFLAILCQQLGVVDHLFNVGLGSAEERVAHRLLYLSHHFGKREGDKVILNYPLTIKEIADSVKVSRESTGRIVKKLEQKDVITISRYRTIIYPDNLARLA